MAMLGYIACFLGSIVVFISACVHLFVCIGAEKFKDDAGTASRRSKFRSVITHFGASIALYIMAVQIAESILGL